MTGGGKHLSSGVHTLKKPSAYRVKVKGGNEASEILQNGNPAEIMLMQLL